MANLPINNGGIVTNKEGMPSIDFRYGPYASLSAAHAALSADGLCAIGLTVGIINGTSITEYWYQGGTSESNLVKKIKVDSVPTKDSPNAVSSGGVYDVTHGTLKTRYIPFDLRGESIIFLSDEDMTDLFGPATMVGGQSMFDLTVGQYQHVYRVTNSKSEVFEIPAAYHNANGARHIVGINGNLTIELSFTITNGVYVNAVIAKRETSIPGISYEEEQDLTDAQRRTAQQNIGLEKDVAGGVAGLNESGKIEAAQMPTTVVQTENGKVPASVLPAYVDDVIEGYYGSPTVPYFNPSSSYSAGDIVGYDSKIYRFTETHAAGAWNPDDVEKVKPFPVTGETGKVYSDIIVNTTYRWSGSTYTQIKGDLTLGETPETAFAGNRGKALEQQMPLKQDTIQDLSTIRNNALYGPTSVQFGTAQQLTPTQQVQAQNNMMGKAYAPAQFSGLGKKVLSKNMQTVDGVQKNVMTQAFFQDSQGNALTNTVFVIQYDYVLGENITIPAGCTLQFDGGSISSGGNNKNTIIGTNTCINTLTSKIFNTDITLYGVWNVLQVFPEWFGAKGDGVTDDTLALKKCIDSFTNSTITLAFGKTLLLDSFSVSNAFNLDGNGGCLAFKNNASMLIDYGTQNVQNVVSIEETSLEDYAVVKIQVAETANFSVGDIVKLISDDIIGNTAYPCTQYFTIAKVDNDYVYCTGRLQFSFTTNLRLALLQNKRCSMNNVIIKGERTRFNDSGLINIRGGVFHNFDNIVTNGISSHGIEFIGCYGYSAKCKTSYQRFNNDDKLIGMAVVDMASSNFVVEIQSEYSQQFSTVYTSDGSIDCIGISQYGLIKGSVVGDSVDGHSRAYRLTYDALTISSNADIAICDRGVECKYLNIVSYAKTYGVYKYTDSNNTGGTTINIANSQFVNCKDGILIETATNGNTAILDSCVICARDKAIRTKNNHVIVRNCYIEGNIDIGDGGTLELYNCVVRNCKYTNYGGVSIIKNSDLEINDISYYRNDLFENCIIGSNVSTSFATFYSGVEQAKISLIKCIVNLKQSLFFNVRNSDSNIVVRNTTININPSTTARYTFTLITVADDKNVIIDFNNSEIYNYEVRGLTCVFTSTGASISGKVDNVVFKDGTSKCILNADSVPATLSMVNNEYVSSSANTRPTHKVPVGYCFFDTSLSPARPIYWNGTTWVDATGTPV